MKKELNPNQYLESDRCKENPTVGAIRQRNAAIKDPDQYDKKLLERRIKQRKKRMDAMIESDNSVKWFGNSRDRQIIDMHKRGKEVSTIVIRLGLHQSIVAKVIKKYTDSLNNQPSDQ